jgi:hypothetical protein
MKNYIAALALSALTLSAASHALAEVKEAPSTVGATYRAASSTTALKPGEKVANLFNLNMNTAYVLQRLTERNLLVPVRLLRHGLLRW